jgi:hypothetical protein
MSEGYAMIRTVGGQTYRVPLSTLQGKKVGEQIAIKQTNPNGQPNTTTATIIQTVPPTHVTQSKSENNGTNGLTSIRANGIPSSVTATGISSSSLVPQSGQKFQIIRPAAPQTITHTIKVSTNGTVGLAPNAMLQIPIRLPDNRIQMLQLPASMLNANRPIQITIPATTNSPATQMIQLTTTSSALPSETLNVPAVATTTITATAAPAPVAEVNQVDSTSKPAIETVDVEPEPIKPLAETTVDSSIELSVAPKSEPVESKTIEPTEVESCVKTDTFVPETVVDSSDTPMLQHQQLGDVESKCSESEAKFEITPQLTSSIVTAALESKSNSPEIQQKLLAMQKSQLNQQQKSAPNTTTTTVSPTGDKKNSSVVSRGIGRSRTVRGNLIINSNSSTVTQNAGLSSEERDQLAIKTLMKAMLDKLEKDDKLETRRKKSRENQLLTKWRQHISRSGTRLQTHSDLIRKEMLRRRAVSQHEGSFDTDSSVAQPDLSPGSDSADDATFDLKSDQISPLSQACYSANGQIANSANQPMNVDGCSSGADGTREANEEEEDDNDEDSGGANNAPPSSDLPQQPCFSSTSNVATSADSANDSTDHYEHSKNSANEQHRSNESQSTSDREQLVTCENDGRTSISVTSTSSTCKRTTSPLETPATGKRVRTVSFGKTMSDNGPNSVAVLPGNDDSIASPIDRQNAKSRKLYCICRQPYDSKRFMVGCDYCHNWFHCDCLRVEEDLVKRLDSFVCAKCRLEYQDELGDEQLQLVLPSLADEHKPDTPIERDVEVLSPKAAETSKKDSSGPIKSRTVTKKGNVGSSVRKGSNKQQLYCICRKPYNESQFYVQCEQCSEWLHGRCVGVLCKEAEQIDVYLCPKCDANSTINYANQKQLDSTDFAELRKLLKQIQQHKNAWPFLRPVDERQVPDYYTIINEPMDLTTIEGKLNQQAYDSLTFFIGDVTKIFDNCRYYNDKRSAITHCADLLENFFVQKIKCLRQNMIGR